MVITVSDNSPEQISAAILRLKKQVQQDQNNLASDVKGIVSNITNNKTVVNQGTDYDDSAITARITALSQTLTSLTNSVNELSSKVVSLSALLSNINVDYNEPDNILYFTGADGETVDFILKDTTYTFSYDSTTGEFTITDDNTGEEVFNETFNDTTYTFAFTDGVLSITDNLTSEVVNLNFDNRYYTEEEIQTLILDLIPAQASSSNQLADKDFVNSSIETATATFRGTYTTLADLMAATGDKNDYAFLEDFDSSSGTYSYDKYTYVEGSGWTYAYTLNTSGFTAEQLAALNSGITSSLVSKITDVYNSTITLCANGTCKGSFTLNQNNNATIDFGSSMGAEDCRITICHGNICDGSFTLNQSCDSVIQLPAYPEVPAVGCGLLTICANGSCVGSFNANSAADCTITIPRATTYYKCGATQNCERSVTFWNDATTCNNYQSLMSGEATNRKFTYNASTGLLKTTCFMLGSGCATESAGVIYAHGTCGCNAAICFLNNTTNSYGNGISIGAGGLTIIGGGEAANTVWCSLNGSTNLYGSGANTEQLYLASDNNAYIYTNLNNGMSCGCCFLFCCNGSLYTPGYIFANSAAGTDIGLFLTHNNDCACCNIGFQVGTGNINRGIFHCKNGTFEWLQYWDGSCERHACPICTADEINLFGPVACTSTATGKGGMLLRQGYQEIYGSTPFIDFHVNNSCSDYSTRAIAECGVFKIITNNSTGCTAAGSGATFCFRSSGEFVSNTSLIAGTCTKRITKPGNDGCPVFCALWDVTDYFTCASSTTCLSARGFVGTYITTRCSGYLTEGTAFISARLQYSPYAAGSCGATRLLAYTLNQFSINRTIPSVIYDCTASKYYLGFLLCGSSHEIRLIGQNFTNCSVSITYYYNSSCSTFYRDACTCTSLPACVHVTGTLCDNTTCLGGRTSEQYIRNCNGCDLGPNANLGSYHTMTTSSGVSGCWGHILNLGWSECAGTDTWASQLYLPTRHAATQHMYWRNHQSCSCNNCWNSWNQIIDNIGGQTINGDLTLCNPDSHALTLKLQGKTACDTTNGFKGPMILFSNGNATQNACLLFNDFDCYKSGASLTLLGDQTCTWFVAPWIQATSAFCGNLCGTASFANMLNCSSDYGTCKLTWCGKSGDSTKNPNTNWWNTISISHGCGCCYYRTDLAQEFTGGVNLAFRSLRNNAYTCWNYVGYDSMNKCVGLVHRLSLPSPQNTKRYYLLRIDCLFNACRSCNEVALDMSLYSNTYTYILGAPNCFLKNTPYGAYGDICVSGCSYCCSNCDCFWVAYNGHRTLNICSAAPVCVVCCTTTAPTGITWTAPTSATAYNYEYNCFCTCSVSAACGCCVVSVIMRRSSGAGISQCSGSFLICATNSASSGESSIVEVNYYSSFPVDCGASITAQVSSAANTIVPYRVSSCGQDIIVDYAICTTAARTLSFTLASKAKSSFLSASYQLLGTSFDLESCVYNQQVSINTSRLGGTFLASNIAGNVITACCFATTSSIKHKDRISPFNACALCILNNTKIVNYNYKTEPSNAFGHVGFIAENTPMVLSGENQDQMRMGDTIGVLIKAVQELEYRTNILKRIKHFFKRLMRRYR